MIDFGKLAVELLGLSALASVALLITVKQTRTSTSWPPAALDDAGKHADGTIARDPQTKIPIAKVEKSRWVAP